MLLPALARPEEGGNLYKYANMAVPAVLESMLKAGAGRERVTAKIAGGSQMFRAVFTEGQATVGQKNIEAVKMVLEILKIPLIAEDTGGEHGRTMTADLHEGVVLLKILGKEIRTL